MTSKTDDGVMNNFDTGATRDTSEGKLVFDKFFSHPVLVQYAKYMNMNRLQSDGQLRDGDNWQKGIPQEKYMESTYRHFMDFWAYHRETEYRDRQQDVEGIGAICGLLFNVMGWLHEWLKDYDPVEFDTTEPTAEMKERQAKVKLPDPVSVFDPHFGHMKDNCDYCVHEDLTEKDKPCCDCTYVIRSFWTPSERALEMVGKEGGN
jgi:hypothetical protein